MGVGILYGKEEILEKLAPFHGGGEMIATCSFEKPLMLHFPLNSKGTPNVGGNIAIGAAIDFMKKVGVENIRNHENELLKLCSKRLLEIDGLKIYGEKANRTSVVSFNLEGIELLRM